MEYDAELIGKKIRAERKKNKLSQEKLGKLIGFTGKQISNYENGKLIPTPKNLLKFCDVFSCELGYLLDEEEYSDGTKLETAILENTGLSPEALNSIRYITGKKHSDLGFGFEYEKYRKILCALLSAPLFQALVENLGDLDDAFESYHQVFEKLKDKIGPDMLHHAEELYNSATDYINDRSAPSLSQEELYAIHMIDDSINQQHDLSYRLKVCRYELQRSFERLIESLYPSTSNE